VNITIFGLTLSSSWGNGHATPYRALLRALYRLGHNCVFYEKDVEYYAWRRDFDGCEYCQLHLYSHWNQVRSQALADAADSDAVIVGSYCPEGARISDDLLALNGPLRVFYDLDTPITLQKLKQGDLDYLRADQIPEFDLYLSFTGGAILQELEQVWRARRARALYGCVDPDLHLRAPSRPEFQCDLSYMGTYAPDRQHKLQSLFLTPSECRPDARFVLAGSLYPRAMQWPENVAHYDHVAPADHASLYSSSRATLNITRDGMARTGYCPSGRFFEAAACGTAILSDWWLGLDSFFRPEEEILPVQNANDVLAALDRAEYDLAKMARRSRERTLDQHTGDSRAQELLAYLEEARQSASNPPVSTSEDKRAVHSAEIQAQEKMAS
jgi:spore maturation protein CgeB